MKNPKCEKCFRESTFIQEGHNLCAYHINIDKGNYQTHLKKTEWDKFNKQEERQDKINQIHTRMEDNY